MKALPKSRQPNPLHTIEQVMETAQWLALLASDGKRIGLSVFSLSNGCNEVVMQ